MSKKTVREWERTTPKDHKLPAHVKKHKK